MSRHNSPSGPPLPGVDAWAHIVDDGSGPVIVTGFAIVDVIKTATGEYQLTPSPPLNIDVCAVGASYRNNVVGVAGVCFIGNVVGPPPPLGSISIVRFQVFPVNILEDGDFDVWIIRTG